MNDVLNDVHINAQVVLILTCEGKGRRCNNDSTKLVKEGTAGVRGGGDTVGTGGRRTSGHDDGHFVPPLKPIDLCDGKVAHPQTAGRLWVAGVTKTTRTLGIVWCVDPQCVS